MVFHFFKSGIRAFWLFDAHDFHLVELVKAVKSANILAIRTCFTTETCRISAVHLWKILLVKDNITVDVGYRNFGSWDKVKVVKTAVVHLAFLVGQLSSSVA